jgi:ABC-type dipeptide/oligopeptide/nickel transport system ATPase component
MDDAEPLLSVRHLVVGFDSRVANAARAIALDGVSFEVRRQGVLGIVGESGSGKSLTALSIIGLLPRSAHVMAGNVLFRGRDLVRLSEEEMQRVRGPQIAMIFQEPATALSPVHTVEWHLGTALGAVGKASARRWFGQRDRATRKQSLELLARVELPDPQRLLDAYPHQLSAGMRRRVLIALALAGHPSILIADEPTTGLDAPIQAQVIDLFARLTREEGMAMIFITHDLSALAELATDIAVMHAGKVVEAGPASTLLRVPTHPYTRALLAGIPGSPSTTAGGQAS